MKKIIIISLIFFVSELVQAEIYFGGGLNYRLFDYAEHVDAPGKSSEKGFIPVFGFDAIVIPEQSQSLFYSFKIELSPEVTTTFDGTTQAPAYTPVNASDKHIFFGYEMSGHYLAIENLLLDFGWGYKWWQRTLTAGTSYKEIYSWYYLYGGASYFFYKNAKYKASIQASVRPTFLGQLQVIFSETVINGADTNLNLGSKIGYRLEAPLEIILPDSKSLRFSVYYEVSGFGRSDTKYNGTPGITGNIYEPESQTSQTGLFAGYMMKY